MIWRRQTSHRPRAAAKGKAKVRHTIHKRGRTKKGKRVDVPVPSQPTQYSQGYNTSDTQQLLGMLALRERRALGSARRLSSQMAKMGKIKSERKHRSSVPDVFQGIVPEGHPFTCVSVYESLIKGEFALLYGLDGRHKARQDEAKAEATEA